jgi:hypothetical protein
VNLLAAVAVLATLDQTLVSFLTQNLGRGRWPRLVRQLLALALGEAMAFSTGLDLFRLVPGVSPRGPAGHVVGEILLGITIAGGQHLVDRVWPQAPSGETALW